MKIAIACDHRGFKLKKHILSWLNNDKYDLTDFGTDSDESVDYPEIGLNLAKKVADGHFERGILICGSGLGMSIVANKVKGIRAAFCMTPEIALLSRRHNKANILVLAGRFTDEKTADKIVQNWISAEFEGGRHDRRVKKIHDLSNL